MPSEVILPRVDMDMTAGKISKWLVESGALVTKGQPLFEIETDKAAMEIEAPATGTIQDLAGASDDAIPVGSVVAWIYEPGEARTGAALEAESPGSPPDSQTGWEPPDRPRATPMARRLAKERGVDLAGLSGTGPRGRIQAQDVPVVPADEPRTSSSAPSTEDPEADRSDRMQVRSPRVDVDASTSVRLIQLREGQGTPLLMVHGFGSDAGSWRPFLAGRATRQPVYALDLPGHGGSRLGAESSFDHMVDAVEAALLGAGLPAFGVIAHSLGAAVATALAARGSVPVHSLLLLAPAGLGPDINGAFVRGFIGANSEGSLKPWLDELVVDPSVITPAFVRSTLQQKSIAAGHRAIADAVFPDDTQAFSIRDDLKRVAIPVRVVCGLCDRIIPAQHARDLPPMVALHRFPHVGHMPHLERRDAIHAIHAQMAE